MPTLNIVGAISCGCFFLNGIRIKHFDGEGKYKIKALTD